MNSPLLPMEDVTRAWDLSEAMDGLWAGISGSRASTKPASGLRPTGFDPGRKNKEEEK